MLSEIAVELNKQNQTKCKWTSYGREFSITEINGYIDKFHIINATLQTTYFLNKYFRKVLTEGLILIFHYFQE